MKQNYNFERKKLMLPEYGRHIHEMVDFLSLIDDREERNAQALAVIDVMGNLNPTLRDTADYAHKLWDHLFIMADFNLDVDSPYPIPTAATLAPRPNKLKYPDKRVTIKHYGKNIERMICAMKEVEDKEVMQETIANIARYMRTKSYEYNQEHPNNEVIIKDIKRLSGSGIEVDEVAINSLKSEYKQAQTAQPRRGGHQQSRQIKGQKGGRKQSGRQQRNRTRS